ncbi:ATP-binding protein [Yinghuangia sp. ASG 101]|uniref:ATP-binding protein n=1 Tax=Yinghuangia sp. ASG 101 TaxID=2896848 RepID=UPI001E369840|nr:ATP-binding protein [Yinghuangia sp. ASG 101]UGQ15465.1 ATP-binding protein [Yinghuangia sp. ASG 101]
MVVARGVPDSEAVLVPHASAGVGDARHRLIAGLTARGLDDSVVDDAALVLSELLSNALKHAYPLPSGGVRAAWAVRPDRLLAIEVTDGGGPTRPRRPSPSLTARGGRGLSIIDALAAEWGVRGTAEDGVTVWALLPTRVRGGAADDVRDFFDIDAVEPLDG